MNTNNLIERRKLLGRIASQTLSKTGALTASERDQLSNLQREILTLEDDIRHSQTREYRDAFNLWLRHGYSANPRYNQRGLTPEHQQALRAYESRDMTTGGGAAGLPGTAGGGYFVPVEFENSVISGMSYAGPMLEVSTLQPTDTGAPRAYPSDQDSATGQTGELVPETFQATAQDVQGMNATLLKSYKFSSKLVRVSMELLNDAGFDLATYLVGRFSVRLGRVLNSYLTTGTGIAQPTGIVTRATQGAVAIGSSGNNGAVGGPGTVGSDDLQAIEMNVNYAYRRNGSYMCSDSVLQSLMTLKDKQGHPLELFKSGYCNPSGMDLLNHRPVYVNPFMSSLPSGPNSPAQTSTVLLYGDMSYFKVRYTRMSVLRLDERFADYGDVGFICWVRADSNLLDGSQTGSSLAVKALQCVY